MVLSAADFAVKVKKMHDSLLEEQLNECESTISNMFTKKYHYSELAKGCVRVNLSQAPLPELIDILTNLGYSDIHFITDPIFVSKERGVLQFIVPQLQTENNNTASDKNTL